MEIRVILFLSMIPAITSHDKLPLTGDGVCDKTVTVLVVQSRWVTFTRIESYFEYSLLCFFRCTKQRTVTEKRSESTTVPVSTTEKACCDGYEETPQSTCQPVCSPACINSYCHGPNQCQCHKGFNRTDDNICKIASCFHYCKENACVTCPSCSEGSEKTYRPRCDEGCKSGCLKQPCQHPPECKRNTTIAEQDCGSNKCNVTGSPNYSDSKSPGALIGLGLAVGCVLFVLLLAAALLWRKRMRSLHVMAKNDIELAEIHHNEYSESCNPYAEIVMSVTANTEHLAEDDELYDKVPLSCDAAKICFEGEEEDSLYSSINEQHVDTENLSGDLNVQMNKSSVPSGKVTGGNVVYAQVNKNRVPVDKGMEKNNLHEKMNEPSANSKDISDEIALYENVNKIPAAPSENVEIENGIYDQGNRNRASSLDNVSEENVLYGEVNKPFENLDVSEENVLYGAAILTFGCDIACGKGNHCENIENIPEEDCTYNNLENRDEITLKKYSSDVSLDSVIYDQINLTEVPTLQRQSSEVSLDSVIYDQINLTEVPTLQRQSSEVSLDSVIYDQINLTEVPTLQRQ